LLDVGLPPALTATSSSPVLMYDQASSTFLDVPGSKPSVFFTVSGVKQLAGVSTSGVVPEAHA
jgi:hypothetical protein